MQLIKTARFSDDISEIRDNKLLAIIVTRLVRIENGNFGDTKSVGDGVSELRIHYGAGYRIYYTIRGREIVVLLCAGPKSDQKSDIKTAKKLAEEVSDVK